jgi:hypothetical protein
MSAFDVLALIGSFLLGGLVTLSLTGAFALVFEAGRKRGK